MAGDAEVMVHDQDSRTRHLAVRMREIAGDAVLV
jgi:hypothetical protein